MDDRHRKIDVALNIAIAVTCLVIVVSLAKGGYIIPSSAKAKPAPTTSAIGKRIPLQGVDWKQSELTVLLILRDDCIYCVKSLPFYKRLSREVAGKGKTRLLVVVPHEVERGRRLLDQAGVLVDEIRQARLDETGFRLTPALVAVDGSGIVTGAWLGTLQPHQEVEVLERVGAKVGWGE